MFIQTSGMSLKFWEVKVNPKGFNTTKDFTNKHFLYRKLITLVWVNHNVELVNPPALLMQQQLNIQSFYSSNVMLRVPLWVLVMNEIENAVIINISILCFTLLFMSIALMNGQISHHSELWDSVLPPFIKDRIVFAEENEALKLLCSV